VIIGSSFFGVEAIKTALNASQKGLDVTGQNIANVNTQGYTRQQLNLSSIPAAYGDYRYTEPVSSNIGQGVNIVNVSQTRDSFLDARFLKQNSQDKTWNTSLSALTDVENVFDEVNTNGLNATITDIYSKLESLASNIGTVENASILRSSAQQITQVLNQYADQMSGIKNQQLSDLGVVVGDTNTLLNQINEMNKEIYNQQLNGETPNELIDSRNIFIDKLSGYVNITVEKQSDSSVSIKTGDIYLLDSQNNKVNTIELDASTYPVSIKSSTDGSDIPILEGEIKGHLLALNGMGSYATADQEQFRGIPYYQQSLDDFAKVFSTTFNNLNSEDGTTPKPLFSGDETGEITASNINISAGWVADPSYITATKVLPIVQGKNENIMAMISAMDSKVTINSTFTGSFQEFAISLMDNIGVDVSYNKEMSKNSDLVLLSLTNQRESVTGVSLDEEAINMIKYQKSYSAAARLMTALDEQLDTLINRMGLVGR
jgi:flagellar hook-associated protein 1 FlgK